VGQTNEFAAHFKALFLHPRYRCKALMQWHGVAPNSRKSVSMEFIEIVGLIAGLCTSSAAIPQIVKTVRTKQAEDVSLFMFIVMTAGNALWTYYGFDKSDLPIIATNLLAIVLNLLMLFFRFKYKKKK
jgi:MtN3 and saliva related transmembrane protein